MYIIIVLKGPKIGKFTFRFKGGGIKDISHLLRYNFLNQYIINLMRIFLTAMSSKDTLLASQKMLVTLFITKY